MLLSLACVLPLMMLSIIGWWIGRFYKLKFGESSHTWILLVGGSFGSLGLFLHATPFVSVGGRELTTILSEVLMLLGGLLVAGGAFWLWYLLMGARRG